VFDAAPGRRRPSNRWTTALGPTGLRSGSLFSSPKPVHRPGKNKGISLRSAQRFLGIEALASDRPAPKARAFEGFGKAVDEGNWHPQQAGRVEKGWRPVGIYCAEKAIRFRDIAAAGRWCAEKTAESTWARRARAGLWSFNGGARRLRKTPGSVGLVVTAEAEAVAVVVAPRQVAKLVGSGLSARLLGL